MTKVYVVVNEWGDAENCKVLSSYEKAVDYRSSMLRRDYITIEEWEVDGEFVDSYAYN